MRISSFAAAVWSWVEGIHAYVVALPRLNAFRMTKANLENKLMKLKTNPGIFGMVGTQVSVLILVSTFLAPTRRVWGLIIWAPSLRPSVNTDVRTYFRGQRFLRSVWIK